MKTLLFIRHAKSSWADIGLTDHQRPLNRRGQRDAPEMGRRLMVRRETPQLMISSTALRAAATAEAIATAISLPSNTLCYNPSLYTFNSYNLLALIRTLDQSLACVWLVGHNPAVTELVNDLGYCDIDNIPTCGMVKLHLTIDHWADTDLGCAEMVYFDYPKNSGTDQDVL